MDAETLLRSEIESLRNEVKMANRRSSRAILYGALAIVFSVVGLLISFDKSQSPDLQNITARSIKILDGDSLPAEVINSDGIEFLGDHPMIKFKSSPTQIFMINQDGLYSFDAKGSELLLDITGMILRSATGQETHFNNGHMFLQTASNYTIDIGTQGNLIGQTAGIKIYNSAFNSPNGGAEISLTPQDIELDDSRGNERASIGQTNLTNSGNESKQITGLSSIVLFDTSGHVIWQSP